ncbi:MAG: ABC transporter permease [Ruminiclostridium sp.]|nr:ABC transporter permease [Ruminiclostridium sp.]
MTVFLTLFKNDIKLFLKDWKACILLLAAPFVFIGFFTYALTPYLNGSDFVEPFSIALVDHEDTPQTRMLTKQLDEMQIFIEVVHTGEAEAWLMLSDGSIASVIIIPPGFTDSVALGKTSL